MKTPLVVVGLLLVIACCDAFAADLNLVCTGEERYPILHKNGPYCFKAMFNLESKIFNIQLIRNLDNNQKLYPRDNPWNAKNCPTPIWKLEITDTELRVITGCDETFYNQFGGRVWQINRADGSFTLINYLDEIATGKCIKVSERAF